MLDAELTRESLVAKVRELRDLLEPEDEDLADDDDLDDDDDSDEDQDD